MQNLFKVDSPYLTYHLDALKELVSKTEDGRYRLSAVGEGAMALMEEVEEPHRAPRDSLKLKGVIWKLYIVTLISVILIAATLITLFIPLNWFPVEGTFRYEYALTPSLRYWWNQTEPIDANSVAELTTWGSPSYGIVEKNLASANTEYLRVQNSFGPCYVVLLAGNRSIEGLYSNEPPLGAPYPPNPKVAMEKIVRLLAARGIRDENCTIVYILWIFWIYAYVPGLEGIGLWSNSEHTLAEVNLVVEDGKITSVNTQTYPLMKNATIQVYNPVLVKAKAWLPPILLVTTVLLQMGTLPLHREREKFKVKIPTPKN